MFDPWTWRDPAALAGGYSGVPDEDLGVDTPAPAPPPDGRTDVDLTGYHFGNDPLADSADAAAILSARGVAALPLTIDEYLFSGQ
ncbi:hypothetical protein ACQEVZ_01125 [Dactylosporangium sp. CA-152071]|uniref:hypothetical protein n=1 Tax=Dactylosporangium sp. CA-152071 TaxID=3239933 RepID=UPI003D89F0F3